MVNVAPSVPSELPEVPELSGLPELSEPEDVVVVWVVCEFESVVGVSVEELVVWVSPPLVAVLSEPEEPPPEAVGESPWFPEVARVGNSLRSR